MKIQDRQKSQKKERIKILPAAMAVLAFALVFWITAPAKAEDPYKVKKGDTLWDISGSMLKDHFQWPLIWKENSRIKNPDRIYPGQKLIMPSVVSTTTSEVPVVKAPSVTTPHVTEKPAVTAKKETQGQIITPIHEEYLFNKEEMLSSGFMTKEVPAAGLINAPVGARALIAKGDDVYLDLKAPVSTGDKFLVAGISKINDPLTGKFSGYLVEPHGIAVVTGYNAGLVRATITDTFERVGPGDMLIKYQEPEEIFRNTQRKPSVPGHVLALEKKRHLGGGMDFIYLDKGSADGLKPGDLLQTKTGPDTNGIIQIMTVQPEFATAMIKESKAAVNPGDVFTGLE